MNRSNAPRDGPNTVLVVEDNPDDRLLLQVATQETCPDVGFHFVPDAFQALAYLRGEGPFADRQAHPFPKVILLDLHLPVMNGFQLLEHIRRLAQCDRLPVLVWSDGADPHLYARAKEAGVEHFLPKSCSFMQLMENVAWISALVRGMTS